MEVVYIILFFFFFLLASHDKFLSLPLLTPLQKNPKAATTLWDLHNQDKLLEGVIRLIREHKIFEQCSFVRREQISCFLEVFIASN